jgi:outer membrane receptor protein involved in Fe transport
MNAFIGYSRKFEPFGIFFNASVTNILGTEYISDANDNATTGPDTFDANSANVMFGMGRRFNLTVGINF